MGIESSYIWLNGELVPFEKASVHFLTSGLHYGLAVFEGIRCYDTPQGPSVFRLAEHVDRLLDSAKILGFREVPWSAEQIRDAIKQTITANGFRECYIRPLIYHTTENPNLNIDSGVANLGIAVWEWGAYLGEEALENGIRMNVSSYTRHHPNVMMTKAKISGNYANSVLAKTESARLGFDEAIMLDPQGYVAECTGENIFLVRKGKIVTPHTAAILEGITRDALIAVAQDLGYPVSEEPVSRDQMYIADEMFLTGTAAEVIAVTEMDFRKVGNGKMGPVTRAIQKVFHATVHGEGPHSAEWLDPVNTPAKFQVKSDSVV
ncbi:MAG TPA: branched-chain amino acid transaminase [Anaerolineaceae bacterium]|jgi:branched-chain amino acid aminotransferase